jgi:hypothetical protein
MNGNPAMASDIAMEQKDAAMITQDQIKIAKEHIASFLLDNGNLFPEGTGRLLQELKTIQLSDTVEAFIIKLNQMTNKDTMKAGDETNPRWRLYLVAYGVKFRQDLRSSPSPEPKTQLEAFWKSQNERSDMELEATWEKLFARIDFAMTHEKIDENFEPKLLHTVRGLGYVIKAPA